MAINGVSSLQGKRVVVTRAKSLASTLQDRLLGVGAVPVPIPALEITFSRNLSNGTLPNELARCDWLLLPSPSAIAAWCSQPRLSNLLKEEARVATLGASSAEAYRLGSGQSPHFVYCWDSPSNLVEQLNLKPTDALLVLGSDKGPGPVLAELISVHANNVYRPVLEVVCSPSLASDLQGLREEVHAITFTSASGVHCFLQASLAEGLHNVFKGEVCIACIGRATAGALREYGIVPQVVCRNPSEADLMEGMNSWFLQ